MNLPERLVFTDGQWIVYERAKELDPNKPADLWIQNMNGSGGKLLVKNGRNPEPVFIRTISIVSIS